jgi:predicted lipoprotein with Yx(FWY)xxD motif
MPTPLRAAIALGTVLLVATTATACSKNDKSPSSSTTPTSAATTGGPSASAPADTATPSAPAAGGGGGVKVATTSLGNIVVDSEGRTLYLFTKDTKGNGKSTCYDKCAAAWPPAVTSADVPAGVGVSAAVATIARTDGTKQITLNGWPLYLWVKDKKPGDTTGQKVQNVWFVVKPDGTPIK